MAEGLVSGQLFAADASLIEADAKKQNSTPKGDWDASTINPEDASRAVREYLDVLGFCRLICRRSSRQKRKIKRRFYPNHI